MTTPLALDSLDEVPLAGAPLVAVLTQVKFSRTPELVSDDGEQQLARLLQDFPVRRAGVTVEVTFTPGSPPRDQAKPVRIFADRGEHWKVTVSESAVALETSAYVSRDDFCSRARSVFEAVAAVATPPVVDRVGLRYVDRLVGGALERLDEYIVAPLRVMHGHVGDRMGIEHTVSDTLLRIGANERLKIRSGLLPPGGAFDPVVPPLLEPCWMLDLDVYSDVGGSAFDPDGLDAQLRRYADHVHSAFRWATTDVFIASFRAESAAEVTR
jgi:uncharacterized protein (TIGR04255 family)